MVNVSKPELIKLVEGKYIYSQNDKNYANEEFSIVFNKGKEHYYYRSEVVSRIDTGELYKTIITADSNRHFNITGATVTRICGNRKADETYVMDENNGLVNYTFKMKDEVKKLDRPWAQKHHLALPCALFSTYYLLNKKFDPLRAVPITVISSQNEFQFNGALQEKLLWGQWKSTESHEFKINDNVLMASEFEIYENEPDTKKAETPTNFKLSKHYYIPYQIENADGVKIVIETLKKYELPEHVKI